MKKALLVLSAFAVVSVQAEMLDRPAGFRIGSRMVVRPYVSMFYTWDSNVDSSTSQGSYSSFSISPGLTVTYRAENWSVMGGAYYQYHAYTENSQNLNQGSWGQNLAFNWTNSKDGGRGWGFVLRENLAMISQDDDMMNDGGRGIGRDRIQMEVGAAVQRRFNEKLHGSMDGSFYYIDYDNNQQSYAPLYGWDRWTAGAQLGYAFSQWIDLFVTGNYQGYTQSNASYYGLNPAQLSGKSQGYSIHGGIGSYATEKITYSITGGYSRFSYSDGDAGRGGFTYTVSGHWRMSDTWNMMLAGSSYFQPDETQYGSMQRTDYFSGGIAHSMVRNKLTATLDLAYRHNNRSDCLETDRSRNDDIITARFGLNYALNRFLAVFGSVEYQTNFTNGNDAYGSEYNWDYNRWRLTAGLRLTY